jgi:hypothetical protein
VQTANLHVASLPQGQLGQLMVDHEMFAVPAGLENIAEQPEQNGSAESIPCETAGKLVQEDIDATPIGAKDTPKESYVTTRPSLTMSKTLREASFSGVKSQMFSRQISQTDPGAPLIGRWRASAFNFLNSGVGFLESIIDMVNKRLEWPLMSRIEAHRLFSFSFGFLIFLNALSMAVAADYEIKNFQRPANKTIVRIELVFVVLYTIELVIRMLAHRLTFFMSSWSWFDIAIVCSGWFEMTSSSGTNLTQVRLMRVLKMLKVMRVLRVMRSLREVRLLLNSLMGSLKPLLWTVIIITGINFMFGICFVQSLAAFKNDLWKKGDKGAGQPESEQLETLYNSWDSMPQAMYTLFKVSTGGVSWGDVSDPLLQLMGWQTFCIFLVYIAFFLFVMTNAVTAIFVSSAEEYANKDAHNMMYDQLQAKQQYMDQVIQLYREMDRDNNGVVTKAEFGRYISDPRMIAFASNLDIDTMDLDQFFNVLSSRGEVPVDLDTFVDGCIRLRGTARSMDVYDLKIHQRTLAQDVVRIRFLLEQQTS